MLEKRNGWEVCRMTIQEKFAGLGIDNAPGQEALQKKEALDLRGEKLLGGQS